jgi:hypothetical protein
MDFIERIFHLAPDGGSGLTEWVIVLACFALACCSLRAFSGQVVAPVSARRSE